MKPADGRKVGFWNSEMTKDERRPFLFIFDTHKASGESLFDYFS
jgi:hypothetical protein